MYRQRWFVILATLAVHTFLMGAVRADVGFFPRPKINIRVCFDNLEEYPGYDFYLIYGLGPGNPAASSHQTRVQFATPTVLEGKGSRMTEVHLLAIPRGQLVSAPPPDYMGGSGPTKTSNGTLRSAPLPGNTSGVRLSAAFDGYLVHYHVHIEGDRLEVTCVDSESPKGWLWTLLGGLGLGVGTAAVVLYRRRRSMQPVHSADAADVAVDPSFH